MSALVPSSIAILLLAAAASALAQGPAQSSPLDPPAVELAQVTIEQRVIIRIPAIPPPNAAVAAPVPAAPPQPIAFREEKGPKCLKLGRIRGALINLASGVTMVTERDEMFRVHVGRSCRAADFYSSFYIEPNKDGSLCAGRDMLHARNGSACTIEKFAKLVPDE